MLALLVSGCVDAVSMVDDQVVGRRFRILLIDDDTVISQRLIGKNDNIADNASTRRSCQEVELMKI